MRRPIAAAVCLLVCAGFVTPAPVDAQKGKYLGLVGGFNSTDFRAPSLDSTFKARIRPLAGISGGIMFNDSWGARIEVLYAQKSATENATGEVWTGDYIQVPLLAQLSVSFSEFTTSRFLISLGPTVAFNIKCSWGDVTCADSSNPQQLDGTDVTVLGALGFGAGPVIFDVRYDLGLVNLNSNTGGPDTKQRSFWITLQYYFKVGS